MSSDVSSVGLDTGERALVHPLTIQLAFISIAQELIDDFRQLLMLGTPRRQAHYPTSRPLPHQ
jgi:hypothetical protein